MTSEMILRSLILGMLQIKILEDQKKKVGSFKLPTFDVLATARAHARPGSMPVMERKGETIRKLQN